MIYKSQDGEKILHEAYDRQVAGLGVPYEDIFMDTRFGKTHVLRVGNEDATPLLLFHGGNSTAAFSCSIQKMVLDNFLVYAVDTIGHPGKSDQKVLSSKSLAYGQWASDVIEALRFERMICMGESFGGGILAKLMCVAPQKIEKAILVVPAGFVNASKAKLIFRMGLPMGMYMITKKQSFFDKAIEPMAARGEPIDDETLEMIRTTFHHVKVNPNMPSPIKKKEVMEYRAPTLLIAAQNDALFPGEKVIKRARELIGHVKTHLLDDCGHLYYLLDTRKHKVKGLIHEFVFLSEKTE